MTDRLRELELLEALNPVPEPRANPGPPVGPDRHQLPQPEQRTADRRQLLLTAAAVVVLMVAGAGLVRMVGPGSAEFEAVSAGDALASTDTVEHAGSAEPAENASTAAGVVHESDLVEDRSNARADVAGAEPYPVVLGEAVARIEIPAIGVDQIVVEGVDPESMRRGPGHYPHTPLPGESGNAAIAGHRTTYGAPFHRLDELELGDEILVTTLRGRFRYTMIDLQVVEPDDVTMLDDHGDDRLTLTTTNPKYSVAERLVVSARLDGEPVDEQEHGPGDARARVGAADLVPFDLQAWGGGFVAIATDLEAMWADPGTPNLYTIVGTADGVVWEPVQGLEPFTGLSAKITVHDETLHIVGVRGDPDGELELFHRLASDLTGWHAEHSQPMPGPELADQLVTVGDVVAADAGVLVSLVVQWWGRVSGQGYELDDVCEWTGYAASEQVRFCGETETHRFDLDSEIDTSQVMPGAAVLAFRSPESEFTRVEPELLGSATEFEFFVDLHSTGTAVGVSLAPREFDVDHSLGGDGGRDRRPTVFRSVDGLAWTPIATKADPAPMIAVHDGTAVYRTFLDPGRFGSGDPAVGMAISRNGEPWQEVEIADLGAPTVYTSFGDLTAGPAGWLMVGSRKVAPSDVVGYDRVLGSVFTLTSEGYVLEGESPFGPATLYDPAGTVVHTWAHLELGYPEWNGLQVSLEEVVIADSAGDRLVGFPRLMWNAAIHPNENFVVDVLHSPNGTDWSKIATGLGGTVSIASGQGEVAMVQVAVGLGYRTLGPFEVVVLAVPGAS